MYKLSHKTKQFFFVLVKLSIVVAAFYFIYEKLTNNSALQLSVFGHFVSKQGLFELKTIVFLILLSFLNWFFEILKWKILVGRLQSTSLKQATEQSLGALTASLLTPNRIGEYGAKALYFATGKRKKAMLINFVGNLIQMVVTVSFGLIGIYFFIEEYQPKINYQNLVLAITIGLGSAVLIGFVLGKIKFFFKGFALVKITSFFKTLSTFQLNSALILSVLRYAIFSFQFFFLLQLFDTKLTYFDAMAIISTMYFLASVVPSIFIFDVVIKGSVAVYLFAFANVNSLTTLSIVSLMWIFNFVVPSMVGSYYVMTFKPKINQALS